jgi:hypothetical protein
MNTSLSIFARALATENISFNFDKNAETASFDTKSRHLIMPMWNVSETVMTMLVAHEISHALWTPYERHQEIIAAAADEGYCIPVLQVIANTIEDVRIEKLMKDKFPGTRRDFFLGYKEIVDKDIFKFSQMDWSKANIVNRLNLHMKWGVPGFIRLDLSAQEQEFVDMIDSVTTFDEVFVVAKRIYEHPSLQDTIKKAKEQEAQQKGNGKGNDPTDGTATDPADGNEVAKSLITGSAAQFGRKAGKDWESSVLTILPAEDYKKAIVSTDVLRAEFDREYAQNPAVPFSVDGYRKFAKESDAFVRQLVAQFDRRKAADEIRRERPKQTGMLNLDRLHQFRTHDDIFLSKIVKQDGKNHGIVFLLDFSGSMGGSLKSCFLQTLQLIWFCEKAKIPFEVFSFTETHPAYRAGVDMHTLKDKDFKKLSDKFCVKASRPLDSALNYGHTCLVHLCSSTDKAADRERLLAMIYERYVTQSAYLNINALHLGGTPTVEAVALISQFMVEWVKANNVQIPTLMVVTDGQPNGIGIGYDMQESLYRGGDKYSCTVMNEILGTGIQVQGKDYNTCFPNVVLSTMFDSLRHTLNAKIVGMFVGGGTFSESFYGNMCLNHREQHDAYKGQAHGKCRMADSPRFQAAKEAYNMGAMLCHPDNNPGYDAFFLTRTPKIVEDADAIADTGTFTKIKNTFVKTMGKRATSRVFLIKYVDIVAGQRIDKIVDKMYAMPGY